MVTKNPRNVHRKCFWTILVTFIFDVKIDVNMCEPHYVNLFFLWTSSIVHVFDFLTFDIFLTNCHLFDILTSFNLNHLSPSQGYFFVLIFLWNGESYSPIWSIANSVGNNVSPLFFGFTSVIPITIGFLGGLSLHLNHLIQSRMEIPYRLFGTLPIGLLLSNLDSRELETSHDILWPILKYVNFWRLQGRSSNLSQKDAFRKLIFSRWRSDKASMRLGGFRWAGPYAIWWYYFCGGATHLGRPAGHLAQKFRFLDTFAAA